jgi:D-alanyl-D-alanine dipeptidase
MKLRLLAALVVLSLASPALAKRFKVPKGSRQLVLVTADSWGSQKGTLTRWERPPSGYKWKQVGTPFEVSLGRAGLGWGLGLHPDDLAMDRAGPLKQEGDGRAPAGAFSLSEALGVAAAAPAGTTFPYRQVTPSLRCIDDPKSKLYNQLVDEAATPKTWASAEDMQRSDALYTWVIVIDHNKKPVVPGQGSCVFLHVAGDKPTSGCTAMGQPDLEALLAWLKPSEQPILVQLVKKDYAKLTDEWKLPKDAP